MAPSETKNIQWKDALCQRSFKEDRSHKREWLIVKKNKEKREWKIIENRRN